MLEETWSKKLEYLVVVSRNSCPAEHYSGVLFTLNMVTFYSYSNPDYYYLL